LAGSIKYFSLVGLIFGLFNLAYLYLISYLNDQGLDLFSQPSLIALGLVLIRLFLSGGLHLDGLMDCFDGIACGKQTREEILTVMKDSRVGAFGSMAGTVALLVQFVALANIDYRENFQIVTFLLFVMPALSRLIMVLVIDFQVDSFDDKSSLAMFKKQGNKWLNIILNIIWVKVAAWIFIILASLAWDKLIFCDLIIIPWIIISWITYAWLKSKLKGHNGDSMGAGLEISDCLLFVLVCILL
jgi:adenosylcobinamide-GDP ribazoletransferase